MAGKVNKIDYPCTTKNGDKLTLEILSSGISFLVIPNEPPFDEGVVDIFTTSLRTTSVMVAIKQIKEGKRYQPPNKIKGKIALSSSTIWIEDNELTFEFVPQHSTEKAFTCSLSADNTRNILLVISDYIEGKTAGPFPDHSIAAEAIFGQLNQSARKGTTFYNTFKLSRNAPCPCGSGKKYKKCCQNKQLSSDDSEVLREFENVDDQYTQALIAESRRNPSCLKDPLYWAQLGQMLGTIHQSEYAITCFNKALEIDANCYGALLNKAATLGFLSRHSEALEIFERIPDGSERKSIMLGHLFRSMGKRSEAKLLFEKAISEEPDFPLPYVNLIELLVDESDYHHPDLEYLMRRAIESVSSDPSVASHYCRYLHANGRTEELAQAEWIDFLKSSEEEISIVGRISNDTQDIVKSQLYRKAGLALHDNSIEELKKGVEILSASPEDWHLCEVALLLIAACAVLGLPNLIDKCYSRRCPQCKNSPPSSIPRHIETMIGQSWMSAGDFKSAVAQFEKSYAIDPNCKHLLHSYYWSLDEVDRTVQAVDVAEKLKAMEPKDPHLNYNLGLMCGKTSAFGRARYYYEEEVRINPKHPFTVENLMVVCLLEKDFVSANEHWDNWHQNFNYILNDKVAASINDTRDIFLKKSRAGVDLINYAKSISDSSTYLLDVLKKNENGEIFIGSNLAEKPKVFSCSDLVNALRDPNQSHFRDVLFHKKLEQDGDYSMIALSVRKEIPSFDGLSETSKLAIVESEKRYHEQRKGDTSLYIVGLCKSFEIVLKEKVFEEYRRICHQIFDLAEEFNRATINNSVKQSIPFLKYLKRPLKEESHLELGGMARAIRLSCGKTANKIEIVSMLRSFIENDLLIPQLCETTIIEEIEKLSELWRNPAAHSQLFGENALFEVRRTVFKLINLIME
jgi:tetratricopeptide (TPR) repeat protein